MIICKRAPDEVPFFIIFKPPHWGNITKHTMYKYLSLTLLLCASVCFAQKKPLDHTVYDNWESVSTKKLSNDGNWVAYVIARQQGDGNLYFKGLKNNADLKVPRGENVAFSADNKFAVFLIKPLYQDVRTAKIKKKKPEEMPKDSLGIVNLNNLSLTKTAMVKSYKLAEEGNACLAYQLERQPDTAKTKRDDKEGTDMIFKNLGTGIERRFTYVSDYRFDKKGERLVFSTTGSKTDKAAPAGVSLLNIQRGTIKTLVAVKGNFKNFVFDEEGEALAFLGETDPEKKEIKNYRIYYSSPTLDTAQILVDQDLPGLPQKWAVSGEANLRFSKNGRKLFFGIAPVRQPKDTSLVDFEHAKLDIWGYKDDYLQPMQLKNADKEIKRSYLSVMDVYSSDVRMIPLTDLKLPDASLVDEGNADYVLASTDFGNRIAAQWTASSLRDYYMVNTKTGSRKKIIESLHGRAMPSPSGKFVLYFDNRTGGWYTYEVVTGNTVHLNRDIIVKLTDEQNDVPDFPSAYGVAGWTEDDKSVLVYDRYDIWACSPDGKSTPKNLTNGYGRTNEITFRIEQTDPEQRFLESRERVLLKAFNNQTKEAGFYRATLGTTKNQELIVMNKASYSGVEKAKEAERYVYDKASYTSSPNVFVSADLKTEERLSNTNPQQQNYNWGTAELVKWNTPKGLTSEGILYKPEHFDPAKKYPMIVYFYEKLSDGLYNYIAPAPTPSRLNISYFVSNGYLVFAPDISYETGYPGRSAEEFINSGVRSLTKNSWVDSTKIGIQGQSWGGYQVAHLITRTNMYAAAWAGAPVVNMTSAYGGMRWESGMNRQFQYEKTQSRIGASLWEKPDLYIENSPLFFLSKVNTPVVIMANDADGAVPWYQGIEMFNGLRRLGKPVWMLNYNNEAHNLVQRQNRKDIQIREQQFFDHYLKGAKAPVWMVSGIPATEKGRNWGFDLTDEKP